jgi:hypothetical protein
MWQEAKYRCRSCGQLGTLGHQCLNCDSRDLEPCPIIYFDNWEEADAFAQKYWEAKLEAMKVEVRDD